MMKMKNDIIPFKVPNERSPVVDQIFIARFLKYRSPGQVVDMMCKQGAEAAYTLKMVLEVVERGQ